MFRTPSLTGTILVIPLAHWELQVLSVLCPKGQMFAISIVTCQRVSLSINPKNTQSCLEPQCLRHRIHSCEVKPQHDTSMFTPNVFDGEMDCPQSRVKMVEREGFRAEHARLVNSRSLKWVRIFV